MRSPICPPLPPTHTSGLQAAYSAPTTLPPSNTPISNSAVRLPRHLRPPLRHRHSSCGPQHAELRRLRHFETAVTISCLSPWYVTTSDFLLPQALIYYPTGLAVYSGTQLAWRLDKTRTSTSSTEVSRCLVRIISGTLSTNPPHELTMNNLKSYHPYHERDFWKRHRLEWVRCHHHCASLSTRGTRKILTDRIARSFDEIRRHTDQRNCPRCSTKGRPSSPRCRATESGPPRPGHLPISTSTRPSTPSQTLSSIHRAHRPPKNDYSASQASPIGTFRLHILFNSPIQLPDQCSLSTPHLRSDR